MEHYVGTTERHPGRRKARLFSATFNGPLAPIPAPARYRCAPLGADLEALANVFSRDQLDRGSELLIAQLPGLGRGLRVADLACGNGVLGLAALDGGLARDVLFCDESSMAVASAWRNLCRLRPSDTAHCEQHLGDGLRNYRGEPFDLVLCNPPFHLQHTVDDFAGRRLFSQAARHLTARGQLCLVANRHLRYRPALARAFARVDQLAQNNKFTVWLASAPRDV
nr:methyltransferase [Parahaliea mediterranea]